MWPLYDPSMYQPPPPTVRLSVPEFEEKLAELSHKPDVDSVFEVMSLLRGQESVHCEGMSLGRFIRHPLMVFPCLALVGWIGLSLWRVNLGTKVVTPAEPGFPALTTAQTESPILATVFVVLPLLVVLLLAVRATLRKQNPVLLAMRAAAARTITRMALDPRYLHEPFSDTDRSYLADLLAKRSRDADQALDQLLSDESNTSEPDPDFSGGERDRTG